MSPALASSRRETLNLTFDDGPDAVWTAKVLERLRECQVKATFFMVGERILTQPEVAAEVIGHGHDVQLHCHTHRRHSEMTEPELLADTEQALDALAQVSVRPRLWRPPWGVSTEATVKVADRFELGVRRWSIDTHDWRGDSADAMLDHARERIGRGGSVLMHDALGPGARRRGCENTLALIPALAAEAHARELALAPMPVPTVVK